MKKIFYLSLNQLFTFLTEWLFCIGAFEYVVSI